MVTFHQPQIQHFTTSNGCFIFIAQLRVLLLGLDEGNIHAHNLASTHRWAFSSVLFDVVASSALRCCLVWSSLFYTSSNGKTISPGVTHLHQCYFRTAFPITGWGCSSYIFYTYGFTRLHVNNFMPYTRMVYRVKPLKLIKNIKLSNTNKVPSAPSFYLQIHFSCLIYGLYGVFFTGVNNGDSSVYVTKHIENQQHRWWEHFQNGHSGFSV